MKKLKAKLKAKLRDWCFADYRWITRAEVRNEISLIQWEYKDSPLIQRVLKQLKEIL